MEKIYRGAYATGARTETKTEIPNLIHFEDPRYGEENNFSEFLSQRADKGGSEFSRRSNKEILARHGLHSVNPESISPYFSQIADEVTPTEWEYIEKADNKLLAIYTVQRFHSEESINEGSPTGPWGIDQFAPTPEEVGSIGALPLVYGTTFERLVQILESGEVMSDRAYYQKLTAAGKQPNAATLENFFTHTYGDDRRAGLDNYVFTFFGRSHTKVNYGNVEILFKPDRLHMDHRSFATENDFIDIVNSGESEDVYRDEILQSDYFIRAAARKLKRALNGKGNVASSFLNGSTDTKDQYGGTTFSTWEIKTTQFTVDDIDSIVFHSQKDLQRFKEQYGERYPTILRPDMAAVQTIVKDKLGLSDASIHQ
ncbi:MAG: hypothetical protein AAB879_03610 [Patescibacteria group bacterium]